MNNNFNNGSPFIDDKQTRFNSNAQLQDNNIFNTGKKSSTNNKSIICISIVIAVLLIISITIPIVVISVIGTPNDDFTDTPKNGYNSDLLDNSINNEKDEEEKDSTLIVNSIEGEWEPANRNIIGFDLNGILLLHPRIICDENGTGIFAVAVSTSDFWVHKELLPSNIAEMLEDDSVTYHIIMPLTWKKGEGNTYIINIDLDNSTFISDNDVIDSELKEYVMNEWNAFDKSRFDILTSTIYTLENSILSTDSIDKDGDVCHYEFSQYAY